jgi:hypothetical protein
MPPMRLNKKKTNDKTLINKRDANIAYVGECSIALDIRLGDCYSIYCVSMVWVYESASRLGITVRLSAQKYYSNTAGFNFNPS